MIFEMAQWIPLSISMPRSKYSICELSIYVDTEVT